MMPLGRLQHIPVCPSLPIQSVMLVDHDQAILAIPRYSLIDFHTETALDSAIASHAPAAAVDVDAVHESAAEVRMLMVD